MVVKLIVMSLYASDMHLNFNKEFIVYYTNDKCNYKMNRKLMHTTIRISSLKKSFAIILAFNGQT